MHYGAGVDAEQAGYLMRRLREFWKQWEWLLLLLQILLLDLLLLGLEDGNLLGSVLYECLVLLLVTERGLEIFRKCTKFDPVSTIKCINFESDSTSKCVQDLTEFPS